MKAGTTVSTLQLSDDDRLLLVDFKWLMAGLGVWIDLTRWRHDAAYARECVAQGFECTNHRVVHQCARALMERGLVPQH
jgi:hypothetical protein